MAFNLFNYSFFFHLRLAAEPLQAQSDVFNFREFRPKPHVSFFQGQNPALELPVSLSRLRDSRRASMAAERRRGGGDGVVPVGHADESVRSVSRCR